MKSRLFIICFGIALLFANALFAQVPQGMSYQSVVRNASGTPQVSTPVTLRFSVLQGSATGTPVYVETQGFTTNAQGLVSGTIGVGTPTQGTFSTIDWSSGSYYLKVEADINNQGIFSISGTSPIVSVPYSLYSGTASSLAATGIANGNVLTWDGANSDPNVALFEVKDKKGNPIFSVYPTGVEIIFDETAPLRSTKGGFAVSGRNSTRAVVDIMRMTADSTTVYVNNLAKRSAKGGFAVSGRNSSRANSDILRVTPDSTRIYTADPLKGFGVGLSSGAADSYLKLTPDNYFIGQESGMSINGGLYNSFMGFQTGKNTVYGNRNIAIGYQSGLNNNSDDNIFVGYQSGLESSKSFNTMVGYQSGYSNSGQANCFFGYQSGYANTGWNNVYIGYKCGVSSTGGSNVFAGNLSGFSNTSGDYNVFVGDQSGYSNTTGWSNNFIGQGAGYSNSTGTNNIFMGNDAGRLNEATSGNIFLGRNAGYSHTVGYGNTYIGHMAAEKLANGANNLILGTYAGNAKTSGDINVFLGPYAGENNVTGSQNVFIGPHAGMNATGSNNVFVGSSAGYDETGSNKLIIANNSSNPLVSGDFTAKTFSINGSLTATTVNGVSDARLKKNISPIPNALTKVMNLRGVNFEWKDTTMKGTQIGFIAQEVEKVVPEVVNYSKEKDLYTLQYAPVTALLVEAMKEQQKNIEQLKAENDALKKQIEEIKQMVLQLKK